MNDRDRLNYFFPFFHLQRECLHVMITEELEPMIPFNKAFLQQEKISFKQTFLHQKRPFFIEERVIKSSLEGSHRTQPNVYRSFLNYLA